MKGNNWILASLGVVIVFFLFYLVYFSQPSSLNDDFSVKLDIHDSNAKQLIIQNDGQIIFTEGDKKSMSKITQDDMESLKQLVLENDFFSLDERYEGSQCCDFIANTITISSGDKTYSVYCYNQCPENFEKVKDKIIALSQIKIEYYGFS